MLNVEERVEEMSFDRLCNLKSKINSWTWKKNLIKAASHGSTCKFSTLHNLSNSSPQLSPQLRHELDFVSLISSTLSSTFDMSWTPRCSFGLDFTSSGFRLSVSLVHNPTSTPPTLSSPQQTPRRPQRVEMATQEQRQQQQQ